MKGMCGWLGDGKNSPDARKITNAMIDAMSDGPSESLRALYGIRDGMAGWSGMGQASCHEEGALKVVVVGNVHWKNEALNGLSLEKSLAVAVTEAYAKSGKAFLEEMHGTFCVAIMDEQEGMVMIAIDRLGIYPLCYAAPKGNFVFATSTDGVVAHPAMDREIDPQAVFNYLFFHMVPSPGSIYKHVRKLLPGQYALFHNGKLTKDMTRRSLCFKLSMSIRSAGGGPLPGRKADNSVFNSFDSVSP